jgi:hypothetical protein
VVLDFSLVKQLLIANNALLELSLYYQELLNAPLVLQDHIIPLLLVSVVFVAQKDTTMSNIPALHANHVLREHSPIML